MKKSIKIFKKSLKSKLLRFRQFKRVDRNKGFCRRLSNFKAVLCVSVLMDAVGRSVELTFDSFSFDDRKVDSMAMKVKMGSV